MGTCIADVVSPGQTAEFVASCWFAADPSAAAASYACGSPQCTLLEDPKLLVDRAAHDEDTQGLWFGISAALLVLSFFVAGPCCCPALFVRAGMACLVDEEKRAEVRA